MQTQWYDYDCPARLFLFLAETKYPNAEEMQRPTDAASSRHQNRALFLLHTRQLPRYKQISEISFDNQAARNDKYNKIITQ